MSHLAPEDVSGRKVRTDNHQGAGRERDLAVIPGLGRGDGGGQDDTGHRGGARGRGVQIQGRVRQMGRPVQVCIYQDKNFSILSVTLNLMRHLGFQNILLSSLCICTTQRDFTVSDAFSWIILQNHFRS